MSQSNIQLTPTPRALKTRGASYGVDRAMVDSSDSDALRESYGRYGGGNRVESPRAEFITQKQTRPMRAGHHSSSTSKEVPFGHVVDRLRDFVSATPQRAHGFLILAVAFAVAFAIFPPLRDYYIALRTQQDLQTYYAELKKANDELIVDIQRLQSTEGIEDEARKRGYVKSGETAVDVEGLTTDDSDDVDASDDADADAKDSDKRPWYTKILDVLFGYIDTTKGQ